MTTHNTQGEPMEPIDAEPVYEDCRECNANGRIVVSAGGMNEEEEWIICPDCRGVGRFVVEQGAEKDKP